MPWILTLILFITLLLWFVYLLLLIKGENKTLMSYYFDICQLKFACPKSQIENLEKGVKYVRS